MERISDVAGGGGDKLLDHPTRWKGKTPNLGARTHLKTTMEMTTIILYMAVDDTGDGEISVE